MDSTLDDANGIVTTENVPIKKEDVEQGNFDDNVSTAKIDINNVEIEKNPDIFNKDTSEISSSLDNVSLQDNAKELISQETTGNTLKLMIKSEEKIESLGTFRSFEEASKIRLSNNINGSDKQAKTPTNKDNIVVKKELEEDSNNVVDQKKPHIELRNMLEDIEEGELDYGEEDDGELNEEDDDLPDLPEYDPMLKEVDTKIKVEEEGEEGEILSDGNEENVEREEGEILDDDETGQVYICVDPVNDKWKKVSKEEQKRLQELEEGQIDDPEEGEMVIPSPPPAPVMKPVGRFIPRTLCKYFNNGLCRWGATCRFLHPGINDDGIPADMPPTWNATAGNYVMHRPPGMYPNAFGKAPSPMECVNIPVMPSPVVDMGYMPHPEYMNVMPMGVMPPPNVHPVEMPPPPRKESAWEKGLRRAKEVKEAAIRKREEDDDFEEKRRIMRIPESRDFDYVAGMEKRPELDLRDQEAKEYYERKYERKMEKYNSDKYYKKNQESEKNRQRIADLPPNHPLRREEQLRREKREKKEEKHREKELEQEYRNKQKLYENRVREDPTRPPIKNIGATEWHDPWMRSQPQPLSQIKPESNGGVEAISNSDSSSSDSDSDSDSSSSDSDSDGSGSSSSGHEGKKKFPNGKTDEERKRDRFRKKQEENTTESQRNKPEKVDSSYEEWKRQQTLQKQASQNKSENKSSPRPPYPLKENLRKTREEEEPKRTEQEAPFPKSISNAPGNKKPGTVTTPFKLQFGSSALTVRSKPNPLKTELKPSQSSHSSSSLPKNDDKFDSPKKKTKESDSDSDSESSDSDNSNSDSSDSDSDDSDTESDSDNDIKAKLPTTVPTPAAKSFRSAPMDTSARKDIKLTLSEKVKQEPPPVAGVGAKRPARKDELLKELKAVEDAIARKRAKID